MAFKILIVEDEELYADKLEMLIDKLEYHHIATVDNSKDALNSIQQEIPDIILMDVHIQGTHDGIELAGLIHQVHPIPVIFITSLKDDLTFSRASRNNPVAFLVKPFNDLQLQRTIELVTKQLNPTTKPDTKEEKLEWENDFFFQEHFFIKTRQKLEKVSVDDVLFLEADGHYCQVHTSNKKFLVRTSLSELSKRLPSDQFLQSHRSYIINSKKIQSIDLQDSVVLFEEHHVPMSKRYKEHLLKQLKWV